LRQPRTKPCTKAWGGRARQPGERMDTHGLLQVDACIVSTSPYLTVWLLCLWSGTRSTCRRVAMAVGAEARSSPLPCTAGRTAWGRARASGARAGAVACCRRRTTRGTSTWASSTCRTTCTSSPSRYTPFTHIDLTHAGGRRRQGFQGLALSPVCR
jgi:hypothetical protein